MKIINRYIAFVAVLAMLFTSCSKEEATTSPVDDPSVQSVDLTFGAMLNDLSNRAMVQSQNKSHFDQVPDCSDAEPAIARIGFSYGGNSYETDVAILSDESGYFTDYSEDLKIPVPNNGSVEVTLDSFMVYDGDPDGDGTLIWIAPIESEEGQFDGYVDTALPFSFDVEDGTKPYIDVEVLCFDRRMVNEYGYVFFDILPDVIYPFCLFVNYCDENGRHYVADYSVDLYFGTDDTGIQLYDHTEESAMAMTGDYGNGAFYADPLCLVVPGPPANLPDNEPYLYLVIYPEDWDGTGDIDNTPTEGISITWEMVSGYLNDDGTTNEYHHVWIGECEGAIGSGDGGGNGGSECNPSDPEADCDNDGILNECDTSNVNWASFDCDSDGIQNGQENEGCVEDPDPNCGEATQPVACELSIGEPTENCVRAVSPGDQTEDYANNGEFLIINMDGPVPLIEDTGVAYGPDAADLSITLSNGDVTFGFDTGGIIEDFLIEISDSEGGDVECTNSGLDSNDEYTFTGSYSYPIYIRVRANICE
ncbi:hypothetical protein [Christiangramia crocea]|uniref:Uncharacterized protein n=1 Tax=Christiangramia crocea TaxID=2904124 RepID=A0A9X1UTM9_9FLAO|nr:hypothetical protein [Gramella crocea]MCG9970077.1 hypothetical protein [Gramella crocea]